LEAFPQKQFWEQLVQGQHFRAPSTDHHETLSNDGKWVELYKLAPKIWVSPKKFGGKAKSRQLAHNLAGGGNIFCIFIFMS